MQITNTLINWTSTATFRLALLAIELVTMLAIIANCIHHW